MSRLIKFISDNPYKSILVGLLLTFAFIGLMVYLSINHPDYVFYMVGFFCALSMCHTLRSYYTTDSSDRTWFMFFISLLAFLSFTGILGYIFSISESIYTICAVIAGIFVYLVYMFLTRNS